MRIILIITVLLICTKAKAQTITAVYTHETTTEIKYDSITTVTGTRIDTTITKTSIKFGSKVTNTSDTTSKKSAILKQDTLHLSRTYQNPVEMKFIIPALASALMTVTVNGQTFYASKYAFAWYSYGNTQPMPPADRWVFGALWATWSGSLAVQATNTFWAPFREIRTQVIFTAWNGENSPITEQYITANKRVLLNVHAFKQNAGLPPGADTNHYSQIDLTQWQGNVTTLVNSISQPDSVVLSSFNEEANRNYSIIVVPSDMQKYVQATSILARTAATRGIKVSNGGITTNALVFTTYRYLSDIGSADTADFMQYCVPRNWWNGLRNRSSSAIEEVIANTTYLLTRYDTIPVQYLPYISAHVYFPLAKRITDTATNWIPTYTGVDQIKAMLDYFVPGRELITNECGFVVEDQAVVTNVAEDLQRNNFRHIIYWNSPDGTDDVKPIASGSTVRTTLGNYWLTAINSQ